ncbi:MAG: [protein-PII] uridylyltransferase, partial [Rhodococcus sp. (in: high G+C Gram-positive bacteria)]
GVWGEWKSSLIGELVRRCRLVMAGEMLPTPDPLDPEHVMLAATGGVHVALDPGESPHTFVVTVIAPDERGLLSQAAGVLALHSLRVYSASLGSSEGSAVNSFVVSPRFGAPPQAGLIRQELIRAIAGELNLLEMLTAKEEEAKENQRVAAEEERGEAAVPVLYAQAPPRIIWFDTSPSGEVILELRAEDRLGLLCRLAAAFDSCRADVRWARVTTLGSSVVDAFCLDLGGDTRASRGEIEKAILAVVPLPRPKPVEGSPGE